MFSNSPFVQFDFKNIPTLPKLAHSEELYLSTSRFPGSLDRDFSLQQTPCSS